MQIHQFDNEIKVHKHHLSSAQIERYKEDNVHEKEEEQMFIDIVDSLPANGCFISIGSAIGYYVVLAKKQKTDLKIHAYEPLDIHRDYLRENLSLNEISEQDVSIHSEGISEQGGQIVFKPQSYSSKLFELKDLFKLSQIKRSFKALLKLDFKSLLDYEKLQTITLSQTLERAQRERVNLVQIDIQGLEYGVLKGGMDSLKNKKIDHLLIGTHSHNIHRDCIQLLKDTGYTIAFEDYNTSQPDGIVHAISGAD